jgi:hypothetical protein
MFANTQLPVLTREQKRALRQLLQSVVPPLADDVISPEERPLFNKIAPPPPPPPAETPKHPLFVARNHTASQAEFKFGSFFSKARKRSKERGRSRDSSVKWYSKILVFRGRCKGP